MLDLRNLDANNINHLKMFLNEDVDFCEYCKRFSREHKKYIIEELLEQAMIKSYVEYRKEQFIMNHPR